MVYFSVYSGSLRKSNATVENSFTILKHQVLRLEKDIMISRFIQKNEEMIRSSLIERKYSLKTTSQKRNNRKNKTESTIDNAEEKILNNLSNEGWAKT